MSEFSEFVSLPLKVDDIPPNFAFASSLPKREVLDPVLRRNVRVPDCRRVLVLANDAEYQRRLLGLPGLKAKGTIVDLEFDEAARQLTEFEEWLSTYPPANGLSPTEIQASQEAVLSAANTVSQRAPQEP